MTLVDAIFAMSLGFCFGVVQPVPWRGFVIAAGLFLFAMICEFADHLFRFQVVLTSVGAGIGALGIESRIKARVAVPKVRISVE